MGILTFLTLGVLVITRADVPCALSGGACVCNATYCDQVSQISSFPYDQYYVIESNDEGARFVKTLLPLESASSSLQHNATISINSSVLFQSILGFGGAFTDAATVNIMSVSQALQTAVMESYFGENGIQYSLGRIPLAGCDFSTHVYTYDDVPGDYSLTHFNLSEMDYQQRIPLVLNALSLTGGNLSLFGTSWSSPGWLKTTGNASTGGELLGKAGDLHHQTWAKYLVKALQFFQDQGVYFWGLTAQNEPIDGLDKKFPFNALGFTPELQRDFIKLDLGPVLSSTFPDVKLMILDDQRTHMVNFVDTVLSDPEAAKFISGIGVHWYEDMLESASVSLGATHTAFPSKFILGTEACTGAKPALSVGPQIGDWGRGVEYAYDIIEDLQNWAIGWTEWNLALDMSGGPNWAKNVADAPIIVDADQDVIYKNPMFYTIGHFSKFIRPNSTRVGLDVADVSLDPIVATAFKDAETGFLTVVVLNPSKNARTANVVDVERGVSMPISLPPYGIQTLIYYA